MICWLCFAGALISIYLIYVENRLVQNVSYKPVCGINDRVSCSKAAKSSFSKLFGIPNAILGVIYYAVIAGLFYFNFPILVKMVAFIGVVFSIYLAFISFFVQKNVCVLCTATYIINLLILVFAFF